MLSRQKLRTAVPVTQNGPRVAMLSVHTSPLAQPGVGDAGGMNVYITELAKALAQCGAHVEIFTRRTAANQPDIVEIAHGVYARHITAGPFEGLDKKDLPGQLCYFTQGVLRTQHARNQNFYDVVHSHYWLSGQAGWLAADRWNVPLIHSMHTMAHVKNAGLAPGDTPEPAGRIIGEEQVVLESSALVANTEYEAQELVDYYDADPRKVHVIAPGVDLDTFTPVNPNGLTREQERAQHGFAPHDKVIVFAGRIQPLKGPDVLVEMLAHIAEHHRTVCCRRGHGHAQARCAQTHESSLLGMQEAHGKVPTLVILGGASGKKSALKELRAHVHQLEIDEHVIFEPPAQRNELAAWFRVADVVAMPSRNESFGLVAVEAQACGTPVIAANVGGLKTAVAHGKSGLLVPGHDPQEWARTIHNYFSDEQLRNSLVKQARAVAATFTWQHTAQATLDVYESVSAQQSKAG
ncbi:glycosyltransferase [Timonella sp. A28]|uniref:glycosyltransferase n=1 Tax=Timonella sp. A28 TaxID=3442640 RepID=UPI003EC0CDCD